MPRDPNISVQTLLDELHVLLWKTFCWDFIIIHYLFMVTIVNIIIYAISKLHMITKAMCMCT